MKRAAVMVQAVVLCREAEARTTMLISQMRAFDDRPNGGSFGRSYKCALNGHIDIRYSAAI